MWRLPLPDAQTMSVAHLADLTACHLWPLFIPRWYKKAIENDILHASSLSNYARLLDQHLHDKDLAKTFHARAVKAAPYDAEICSNYAAFMVSLTALGQSLLAVWLRIVVCFACVCVRACTGGQQRRRKEGIPIRD